MTFECEYCNNILKTKYSLNVHLKSNKKCLMIRNPNNINFLHICEYCDYKTNQKENYLSHLNNCKNMKIFNSKLNIEHKKEKEINEITQKLDKEKIKNIILMEKIEDRDIQINDYKKQIETLQQTIVRIAEQPKNITNNNNQTNTNMKNTVNNTLQLVFALDSEEVKRKVEEKYLIGHHYKGLEGVAKFCYDNILCNEKGECMLGVSDKTRSTLIYKNKHEQLVRDHGCIELIDMLYPPVLDKSSTFFKDEMKRNEEIMNTKKGKEKTDAIYMDQQNKDMFLEIRKMKRDKINKFREPLIKNILTNKNTLKTNEINKIEEIKEKINKIINENQTEINIDQQKIENENKKLEEYFKTIEVITNKENELDIDFSRYGVVPSVQGVNENHQNINKKIVWLKGKERYKQICKRNGKEYDIKEDENDSEIDNLSEREYNITDEEN
jgi:hypothetical protein